MPDCPISTERSPARRSRIGPWLNFGRERDHVVTKVAIECERVGGRSGFDQSTLFKTNDGFDATGLGADQPAVEQFVRVSGQRRHDTGHLGDVGATSFP